MSIKQINFTIEKLNKWMSLFPNMSEKTLECFLVTELLCGALEFEGHFKCQDKDREKGIADVVLKVNLSDKKKWVILELKAPSSEKNITGKHIRQAAQYAARRQATRCIVTNGNKWVFLCLEKSSVPHMWCAHVVLWMDTRQEGHSKILMKALSRCRRKTILRFFDCMGEVFTESNNAKKNHIAYLGSRRWAQAVINRHNFVDGDARFILSAARLKLWSDKNIKYYQSYPFTLERKI